MWGKLDVNGILRDAGVPYEKIDACLEWAFGEGYGPTPIISSDDLWNKRHSDIFVLYGSDNVIESLERIGKAYLENELELIHGR